jgi:hypothetical protein
MMWLAVACGTPIEVPYVTAAIAGTHTLAHAQATPAGHW